MATDQLNSSHAHLPEVAESSSGRGGFELDENAVSPTDRTSYFNGSTFPPAGGTSAFPHGSTFSTAAGTPFLGGRGSIPAENGSSPGGSTSLEKGRRGRFRGREVHRRFCGAFLPYWGYIPLVLLLVSVCLNIYQGVHGPVKQHQQQNLTVVTYQASEVPPVSGSFFGAAAIQLSEPFTLHPENKVKLAYNAAGGKLCIREKLDSVWKSTVTCVTGLDIKPNSPLSMLDWLGGPTIYFITPQNTLSGIDWVPVSSSYRISTLASLAFKVHQQSQLASMTWRNGTAAWLYVQSPSGQIWELGIDDFRDELFHNGPTGGPLGMAILGSGIATTRWVNGSEEVQELFYEEEDGPIVQKVYAKQTWQSGTANVNGTSDNVSARASISAATVKATNGTEDVVVLAYVSKDGFLEVQTRKAVSSGLDYSAFGGPVQVVEGNGAMTTGLVAVDEFGVPALYFNGAKVVDAQKVGGNWTVTTIGV